MKLIAIAETTRFAPPMIRRVAFIDHTQIDQFERNLDCDVHYFADAENEEELERLHAQLQHADEWFIHEWMKRSESEIFYF